MGRANTRGVLSLPGLAAAVSCAALQIVVLTQRSKLEMEGMFWRCLPEPARHGTKLVFRQGSPLVPSDLKLVGASRAAATAIISDQSRCAAEADAQALRCGGAWTRSGCQPGGAALWPAHSHARVAC
jgi:hypothetical protein